MPKNQLHREWNQFEHDYAQPLTKCTFLENIHRNEKKCQNDALTLALLGVKTISIVFVLIPERFKEANSF